MLDGIKQIIGLGCFTAIPLLWYIWYLTFISGIAKAGDSGMWGSFIVDIFLNIVSFIFFIYLSIGCFIVGCYNMLDD